MVYRKTGDYARTKRKITSASIVIHPKIWRTAKIGNLQKPLNIVMHPLTESSSAAHLPTDDNSQNKKKKRKKKWKITYAEIVILLIQFRRTLCVVGTSKAPADCQKWYLSETIKHSYKS